MRTILLVASKRDEAGVNIARRMIELHSFKKLSEQFQDNPIHFKEDKGTSVKLVYINQNSIDAQFITEHFSAEYIIFLSRHSSTSGIPTLSVHTPGNLTDEAKFGGKPNKVSVSPASMMKNVLLEMAKMKKEMGLKYEVSFECTHHGPSLDVPTMFAELGSSPEQWRDQEAAEAVARAVVNSAFNQSAYPTALGIGGPHYNLKFTEIALETSLAFGHIIPKYAAPFVEASMMRQCVERTKEKVESAVFDWKGVSGADRKRLVALLNDLGLKNIRRV